MITITGGRVVTPDGVALKDIRVEDGKITAIGEHLPIAGDHTVIDAQGAYVLPGFIDAHTHFDMTNAFATTADDYDSGTAAAVLGGTTTIINFASPGPSGSLTEGLELEHNKADGHAHCNYKFHMELLDMNGQVAREIETLRDQGVTSYKLYMAYTFSVDDEQIYRILKAIKTTGALIGAHCENGDLIKAKVNELVAQGHTSVAYHGETRPNLVESEAVNRFISIGEMADCPVHIVHVSTSDSVDVIESKRQQGALVTAETCPHYLLLTDDKYKGADGALYVMSPPLRKEIDRRALLSAIKQGVFQTIATDHCSYTKEQKLSKVADFRTVPGGIPGVQERGLLMYTLLVEKEGMHIMQFMRLLSENPAKLYGIYPQKGCLAVGSDADITILDVKDWHTLEAGASKAGYSPFSGIPVLGRISHVLVNGEHVVNDGKLVQPYAGRFVK